MTKTNLENVRRYIACARRWRLRGHRGAAVLYQEKAAACRIRHIRRTS